MQVTPPTVAGPPTGWAWGICLALALAVFCPILLAEYVYDGRVLMERLGALPPAAWRDLWDPERFAPLTGILSWRPFMALSMHWFDLGLFRAHAPLSAALNLCLHGLNAWLILRLLWRLLARSGCDRQICQAAAWTGALLFLLHPLVSEAVLCVGFRADLVAAAAILGTSLLVLRWAWPEPDPLADPATAPQVPREHGPTAWLLGAAGLFACGLMFKEVAVAALPCAPILLFLNPEARGTPARRARTVGIVCAVLLVTFLLFLWGWLQFRYPGYPTEFMGQRGRGIGMVNAVLAFREVYLARLAWPWPLRVDYGFEAVSAAVSIRVLHSLVILACAGALAVVAAWRNRLCACGLAWFVIAFVPVSQVVPVPDPVAERFCYVPMLGAALFLAGLVQWSAPFWLLRRRTALAVAGGVAVIFASLDFRRAFDWRDDVRLNLANWEQAGDTRPRALEARGALHLRRALELHAAQPAAAAADFAAARENLEALLAAVPDHVQGHRLFAVLAQAAGKTDVALDHARQALALAPNDPQVQETARAMGLAVPSGVAPR